MAKKHVRKPAAVITTSLAVAALLVAPAVTLGLDVPVVGGSAPSATQVAATTQTVVQTTQETAASTVTTVQTTVQTAAPAPAAEAPAAPQVQTSAPALTSAPKQVVQKAAAPPRNKTRASTPAKTTARQISSKAGTTREAASSATASVRESARTTTTATRSATTRKLSAPRAPASALPVAQSTHASSCTGLPLLDLLPAELGSLLSLACDATGLVIPVSLGTARGADPAVPLGGVLAGVTSSVLPALARAADLQRVLHVLAERKSGVPISPTPTAAPGINSVAGAAAAGSHGAAADGRSGGAAYAQAAAPSGEHPAGQADKHRHLGVLSQPVDGTSVLSLVLLIDAALLGAILMWRATQRWLVPRFA